MDLQRVATVEFKKETGVGPYTKYKGKVFSNLQGLSVREYNSHRIFPFSNNYTVSNKVVGDCVAVSMCLARDELHHSTLEVHVRNDRGHVFNARKGISYIRASLENQMDLVLLFCNNIIRSGCFRTVFNNKVVIYSERKT